MLGQQESQRRNCLLRVRFRVKVSGTEEPDDTWKNWIRVSVWPYTDADWDAVSDYFIKEEEE